MADKRVLQVVYSLGVGGSEMVARNIAFGLKNAGWDNAVCALERDGALRPELEKAGIPAYVTGRAGGMIRAMLAMIRVMRAYKPDIVHTHHLCELFHAWPGALACGARIVHTEHEYFSLGGTKARLLLRMLAPLCRRITAVNRETAGYIERLLGWADNRVATIVNGIDLPALAQAVPNRAALDVGPHIPVLAVVARLEPVKAHGILLEAFRTVLDRLPKAVLLIIGDGSLRSDLETMASVLGMAGSVRFLGLRRDIPEILAASDVVALPSLEEGLPVSILEAMAASKPVVASAVGGIPGVVEDGSTGFLVPPGDVAALAEALTRLLSDKELSMRFGRAGLELIQGQYEAKAMVRGYKTIYEQI